MKKFKHWTPRYIYHRLELMAYQRTHPNVPWLTQTMVDILDEWLKPNDRGIEWGSGRSTIWFAERVAFLVSLEHNLEWYKRVSAELKRKNLQNVEYHLREDEQDHSRIADKFPPESFDFCLVDGIARDECALAAISLLRPGGILIADNCNWYLPTPARSHSPFSRRSEQGPYSEKWRVYLDEVEGWRNIWTTNGVFDTAMWVKPINTGEPKRSDNTSQQFSVRVPVGADLKAS